MTLTLAAFEDVALASVSICIHTPLESFDAPPAVYTCDAFQPPANPTISIKRAGRVVPLKVTCSDADGNAQGDGDIAAPVLTISQVPGGPLPGTFGSQGQGTADGEFEFAGSHWPFNLDTAACRTGTYQISIGACGDDLLLGAPIATLIIG